MFFPLTSLSFANLISNMESGGGEIIYIERGHLIILIILIPPNGQRLIKVWGRLKEGSANKAFTA